jgi:ribose transport system substrate-binding protein
MKKARIILYVVLMSLSAAGGIFAKGGQQSGASVEGTYDPSKMKVAFVYRILNHPTIRMWEYGFIKAAQDLGYTQAKILGTETSDISEAIAAYNAFVAEGGRGIVMPVPDSSLYVALANAYRTGGAITGTAHYNHLREDGTLPEGLFFCTASDPVKYGAAAAELLAGELSGKTGSVAVTQAGRNLIENAASDSFIATWNGPLQNKYNIRNIRVLPVQLETAVLDQATNINLAIIQANPDLLAAFGTTGGSPISWGDAASKAGKREGELLIVGMDATTGNLDYLENGKCFAIVAQPIFEEFYLAMDYLDKVLRGQEVPKWTPLDAPLVTRNGQGPNGPAYHRKLAAEANAFFSK